MTTRAEFFRRLRGATVQASALFPAAPAPRPPHAGELAETIRRELSERWPQTLDRFRIEFERVGGVFHRVPTSAEVPSLIARLARERDARRLVAWHPDALGADWSTTLANDGIVCELMPPGAVSDDAERARLRAAAAAADLGLTGLDLAIAETGTLVLRSGPGRPRSTSLLPPYHLAVFDREALVETLQQLGVFLEAWHADDAGSGGAINLITGPSRTADIELTLTRGVHGPREVHAIFVDAATRDGRSARRG
jgi:L-lactate dehydrogenase complex protein LldG